MTTPLLNAQHISLIKANTGKSSYVSPYYYVFLFIARMVAPQPPPSLFADLYLSSDRNQESRLFALCAHTISVSTA
jgi:hypothetical protein